MSKRKGQTNGNKAPVAERDGSAGNAVPDGLDTAGVADAGGQAAGTPPSADSTAANAAPVVAGSNGVNGAAKSEGMSDGRENVSAGSGASADSGDAGNNVPGDIGTGSSSGSIENDGDASADGAADGGKDGSVSGQADDQSGSVGGGDTLSTADDEGGKGGTGPADGDQGATLENGGGLPGAGPDISPDLKAALDLAGCDTAENLIDMARIGSNVMNAIDDIRKLEGPFKDWAPMDDPAEVVHDLYNALEYAREKAATPALDPASNEAPAEVDRCPICDVPFKPDDICAADIEEGTCHAECLAGTPVVDLDTGEPSDGPICTFLYSDDVPGKPAATIGAEMVVMDNHASAPPIQRPWFLNVPHFAADADPLEIARFIATDVFGGVHGSMDVFGVIIHGGEPLEYPAVSREAVSELVDLVRKIGPRATPEVMAQHLVITKHRTSPDLTTAEHVALKTFASILIDLDDFAAAEKKRLEELAAEKPEPRLVPIEDTTMETVNDTLETW